MSDWQESAACSRIDPDLWWPTVENNTARIAKFICSRCEVKVECLAAAGPDDIGIWGGLTQRQRGVSGRRRGKDRMKREIAS